MEPAWSDSNVRRADVIAEFDSSHGDDLAGVARSLEGLSEALWRGYADGELDVEAARKTIDERLADPGPDDGEYVLAYYDPLEEFSGA